MFFYFKLMVFLFYASVMTLRAILPGRVMRYWAALAGAPEVAALTCDALHVMHVIESMSEERGWNA